MQCPACKTGMTAVGVGSITIDVCEEGCGGVWLDWLELEKLDNPEEPAPNEALSARGPLTDLVPKDRRLNCPKCPDVVMMRHFESPRRVFEVDECPNCGGHFLDAGELAKFRAEHAMLASEHPRPPAPFTQTRPSDPDGVFESPRTERMMRWLTGHAHYRWGEFWG